MLWHKREWHNSSLLSGWTFLSDFKDLTAEVKISLSSQHTFLPQQCTELSHLHWDARIQEKVICSNLTTDLPSTKMLNLYFLKNVLKVTLHVYHPTKNLPDYLEVQQWICSNDFFDAVSKVYSFWTQGLSSSLTREDSPTTVWGSCAANPQSCHCFNVSNTFQYSQQTQILSYVSTAAWNMFWNTSQKQK